MTLGQRYANAIEQLLPQGWAWQRRGCDDSLLGRVIRANGEELARFQVWLEQSVKASIERFADIPQGWSAPDYERLLSDKFGITATVTDNEFCTPEIGSPIGAALYSQRYSYIFTITVDDLSTITPVIIDYLRRYKQSHTALHIRERKLHWHTDYDIHALDVSNAACGSELYTHDYHGITVAADETWCNDLTQLDGINTVNAALRDYTTVLCHQLASDVDRSVIGDPLYGRDWHITERVQTHINYQPQAAAVYG